MLARLASHRRPSRRLLGLGAAVAAALLCLSLPGAALADAPADEEDIVVPPPTEPAVPPPPPPAEPADPYWRPYLQLDGFAGNLKQGGRGQLVIPFWQDPRHLAFLDLRMTGDSEENLYGETGLGLRRIVDDRVILGGYGFFGIFSNEEFGDRNTFFYGILGLEALTETFDLRVNGYLPENDKKRLRNAAKHNLETPMFMVRGSRLRMNWGLDWEVGVRMPFSEDSPLWDTRFYVGGYFFDSPAFEHLVGPKGRLETRLHVVPWLGEGARLVLGGEGAWDRIRESVGRGFVEVRVPFGALSPRPLTRLERRMTDPVRRLVE